MKCERFDDLAELYVLGELPIALAAEADAHLAECAACRQGAEAARTRLRALESALAAQRVPEDFVERTMARVRAETASDEAEPERPEPLRSRVLRYAALAAAAALLAMGGYGLLRPRSGAWLESGTVAVLGPSPRALRPNEPLAPGQELATPPGGSATLALAGGRLRVAMAPLSRVRVLDPSSGTALQLLRGEIYCRGSESGGTPMVASALANVAAGPGVVSLHAEEKGTFSFSAQQPTAPQGGERVNVPFSSQSSPGMVIVAALGRGARVAVPGQQGPAVPLEQGQVLTLSADRPAHLSVPIPIERLRQSLEAESRAVMTRHGELELRWDALMRGLGESSERLPLPRLASDVQEALGQTRALHGELMRRLKLLDRCEAEGHRAFRILVQPTPGTR